VVVKGRNSATTLYEIMGMRGCPEDADPVRDALIKKAMVSKSAFNAFSERRFSDCVDIISQWEGSDEALGVLRTKAADLIRNPPPRNWDCCEVLQDKFH